MYCLQGVVKKRLQGVVKKIVCRVQKKSWAVGCRSAGCHVRLTVQTKRSSAGCILGLVMNVGAVGDRVSVRGLSVVGMNAGAVGLSVVCRGDVFVNCARPALSAAIIAVLIDMGAAGLDGRG